ncbi:hypothetical protein AVEN_142251-1 [Araneus ventricosus]|uniref:Uncharacterized protein n=1 Tax=Araneus ventricosus TaxID=182803 RepID=A0A4Y2FHX6_ARAVE|nr:hypothetical protein AVEN_142251-1 [Araneus ventricosus]
MIVQKSFCEVNGVKQSNTQDNGEFSLSTNFRKHVAQVTGKIVSAIDYNEKTTHSCNEQFSTLISDSTNSQQHNYNTYSTFNSAQLISFLARTADETQSVPNGSSTPRPNTSGFKRGPISPTEPCLSHEFSAYSSVFPFLIGDIEKRVEFSGTHLCKVVFTSPRRAPKGRCPHPYLPL